MAQCWLCSKEDPSKAGCGSVCLLSLGNNDEMRSEGRRRIAQRSRVRALVRVSVAVKRNHDHGGNSYEGKHLIGIAAYSSEV